MYGFKTEKMYRLFSDDPAALMPIAVKTNPEKYAIPKNIYDLLPGYSHTECVITATLKQSEHALHIALARLPYEQKLDANPADWELRLQYADLLEKCGLVDEAYGMRWQGENWRHPFNLENREWTWNSDYDFMDFMMGRIYILPNPVYNLIESTSRIGIIFPNRHAAERPLGAALREVYG